jgi:opacity protein-like surface antigen
MPYLQSMRLALLAGIALTAAPVAQAADLGATPEPSESWTGFYVGGGAGVGFFSTDVSTSSSRTDQIGFCKVKDGKKECEKKEIELTKFDKEKDQKFDKHDKKFDPFATLFQSQSTNSDLGDEGFFGTVQLGYDKQFGPRWLIGAFVDGDWYSNLKADSHSSTSSALNIDFKHFLPPIDLPLSKLTTDTSIGLDWTVSVGGRLGVLATPGTLLYVLGAYTHAELDNARVNVLIDDPFGSLGKLFHEDISSPAKIALNLPDSLNGFSLGAGTEARLGHGPWSIKLEYRWSHFEGDSAKGSSSDSQCIPIDKWKGIGREIEGTASASYDDVDIQSVRGVLTYRFGGAPDEVASLK